MPEAVELLQCPACLSGVLDGRKARCPECRTPVGMASRPLPLLEQELQARIEAKTATRYRQRRRAAKVARRIAALPPTMFGQETVGRAEAVRPAPMPAPGASMIVDLPPEAVLAVRSTAVIAEVAARANPAVARPPRRRSRRRAGGAGNHPTEHIVAARPAEEPVWLDEPVWVEEPVPVEVPRHPKKRSRARKPPRVEEPAAVEEQAPVEASVGPAAEEPPEPTPTLASVTRIGAQGTNPVWRDRVFNSPRRRPEFVTWPRPRTPAAARAAEPFDRFGGAAG